jgi:hypothetical protein
MPFPLFQKEVFHYKMLNIVQISKLYVYEALTPDIGNKQFYLRDDILLRKGSVA